MLAGVVHVRVHKGKWFLILLHTSAWIRERLQRDYGSYTTVVLPAAVSISFVSVYVQLRTVYMATVIVQLKTTAVHVVYMYTVLLQSSILFYSHCTDLNVMDTTMCTNLSWTARIKELFIK